MGQKYPPCDLFDESKNDVPLILLISPMPLHLLIGITVILRALLEQKEYS